MKSLTDFRFGEWEKLEKICVNGKLRKKKETELFKASGLRILTGDGVYSRMKWAARPVHYAMKETNEA